MCNWSKKTGAPSECMGCYRSADVLLCWERIKLGQEY